MKTSQKGIDLIKRFEGLELEPYQDIAGVWTIGYGHTGKFPNFILLPGLSVPGRVGPGSRKLTYGEAQQLLKYDLISREHDILKLVSVPINQNQFDALVSFVYNVGVSAFKTSTALRKLNAGDYEGAAKALNRFNKARLDGVLQPVAGLTRRRLAEQALFLEPSDGETPNTPDADGYLVDQISNVEPVETGFLQLLLQWINILK